VPVIPYVTELASFFGFFENYAQIFLYLPIVMSLYGKTISSRACGAGSYVPNKAMFFPLSKNHSESHLSDFSIVFDANKGISYKTTTPPPPIV